MEALRRAPKEVKDELLSLVLLRYLEGLGIRQRCDFATMRAMFETSYLFRSRTGIEPDDWYPPARSLFDVAYAFERMSAPAETKREGIFYTPRHVVSRMVDECLARAGASPRVTDPACGGGLFLLECARSMVIRGSHPADALGRLSGADRDPRAAELCRVLLGAQAIALGASEAPRANVVPRDSLLNPEASGRFEVVIGNPPYGLSRDGQISPEEKERLMRRYAAFRNGKVNKYILFMALGMELLGERGIMSFIVPNAWLGISGGVAIREALLARGRLHFIDLHLYSVFSGASVEAVTFLFEKGAARGDIAVRSIRDAGSVPVERRIVSVEACLADPERRIPVIGGTGSEGLERRLMSLPRLGAAGAPFRPMIALQAYAVGKGSPPQTRAEARSRLFHGNFPGDPSAHPYLEGSDVSRYAIRWSGRYLRHGPWLAEPQKIERFQGPRVVLREILGSGDKLLGAAFLEETMLYNKSVLHVLPERGTPRRAVLALCGLLNSRVASFWIMRFGRKSQRRLFPKIVNADIAGLPLPAWFVRRSHDLGMAVEERLRATDPIRSLLLEKEIESEVAALYGLSASDRAIIEDFLAASGR